MGVSGHFLGGAAIGMKNAAELEIKEDENSLREKAIEAAQDRSRTALVDKSLSGTINTIHSIIGEARKAGAAPEKIRSLIGPLVDDVQKISAAGGRDPGATLRGFDALIGIPMAQGEASPTTEIGKLRADMSNGFITKPEFDARVEKLTREAADPNIFEQISRKKAAGEILTPGEQTVYDDRLRADPIARLIAGALGGNVSPPTSGTAATGIPAPPKPKDPFGLR